MELNKENFDAIIIGSGIGGLVTASQLAAKGARVLVLEKYIIPGGSGGSFKLSLIHISEPTRRS